MGASVGLFGNIGSKRNTFRPPRSLLGTTKHIRWKSKNQSKKPNKMWLYLLNIWVLMIKQCHDHRSRLCVVAVSALFARRVIFALFFPAFPRLCSSVFVSPRSSRRSASRRVLCLVHPFRPVKISAFLRFFSTSGVSFARVLRAAADRGDIKQCSWPGTSWFCRISDHLLVTNSDFISVG